MALTPEQLAARRIALAKGHATAVANRKAVLEKAAARAAPEPPPAPMPPIAHGDAGPLPELAAASTGAAASESFSIQNGPDTIKEADEFQRFLASQDAEMREAFTDSELRVVYNNKVLAAADERKAVLRKRLEAKALRHARAAAGLIGPEAIAAAALRERMEQKVSWVVNMPEAGNSGTLIDAGIRIDGVLYPHGSTMTGTLAEYISYREIEGRAHENERQFQGRSRMSRMAQTGMRFLNNEGHG